MLGIKETLFNNARYYINYMKFDPINKDVYADNGQFLKKLNCPYGAQWEKLELANSSTRKCSVCSNLIFDTESLKDSELIKLISENPKACLKINLNQNNVKIISDGILEQK